MYGNVKVDPVASKPVPLGDFYPGKDEKNRGDFIIKSLLLVCAEAMLILGIFLYLTGF